jgi:mevalonate kinase
LSGKALLKEHYGLRVAFRVRTLQPTWTNDSEKAAFLSNLLSIANELNPGILSKINGFDVVSNANFNVNWGLGSSSTLISNIAYWVGVNPFDLHFAVSKGSGYDIACARSTKPILYQLNQKQPDFTEVDFNPVFKEQLYFVYLGKKQRSDQSIQHFGDRINPKGKQIDQITGITENILKAANLKDFRKLTDEHEHIISDLLKMQTVKDIYFSDLEGSVKSLGAWGGDFVMIAWEHGLERLRKYVESMGLRTIFVLGKWRCNLHPVTFQHRKIY